MSKAPKAPATPTVAAASDNQRAINNRRLYLKIRIEEVRSDLARLIDERKSLPGARPK